MSKEYAGGSTTRGGAAPGRPAPSWPASLLLAARVVSPPNIALSPVGLHVGFHRGALAAVLRPTGLTQAGRPPIVARL
jgi:hypothetical protein